MILVRILEAGDVVKPDDWCRPLRLDTMSPQGDGYAFTSPYSGSPDNNVCWVRVRDIFGPVWFDRQSTVRELCKHTPYEFIRGTPPQAHILR